MTGKILRAGKMFNLFHSLRSKATISRFYIEPPAAKAGRAGIAIAAVVKNEAAIMREWLLHHHNIGIGHFYLYDNGCCDGTIDVAKATLKPDHFTIIPWSIRSRIQKDRERLHQQSLAFAHAIQTFGSTHSYMAFIDPDEFIIPKQHLKLADAIRDAGDPPCMALPWHMFGRNGHQSAPAAGVGAGYLERAADLAADYNIAKFKCIVDPCEVTRVDIHNFETRSEGAVSANDLGVRSDNLKRHSPRFLSASAIQLNHYYTRSDEELRAKIARSSNQEMKQSVYERRVMERVYKIEQNTVRDEAILELRARAPELEWL